jgi:hypothetical protein
MLDLNISTTCAKGHFKKQTFFFGGKRYDHDMLEEDVKIHDLEELLEDDGIARLVTVCVVWFEALCYFKIVIFGIILFFVVFSQFTSMKISKITFDYKFFVFQLQNIGIQQKKIILNHIFQFENFSKKKKKMLS